MVRPESAVKPDIDGCFIVDSAEAFAVIHQPQGAFFGRGADRCIDDVWRQHVKADEAQDAALDWAQDAVDVAVEAAGFAGGSRAAGGDREQRAFPP